MNDRNFICKYCEKSYLSNAALYTHVKNKHEPKNNSDAPKKTDQAQNQIQQQ